MAGLLLASLRLRQTPSSLPCSSSPSSSSSPAPASSSSPTSTVRLLFLLTLLPITLAAFALLLQWPESFSDSITRWFRYSSSPPPSPCVDLFSPSSSPSFPYYRGWNFNFEPKSPPSLKISITTTTSSGLDQLLPWILFHKVIGVTTFFMFVEGTAASPNVSKVLETIPGVQLIYRTKELEQRQAKSRIWNETWLADFFYKPCNNELFVKQNFDMEVAIVMAREAGLDWIIHLDTDELLHPAGGSAYSIQNLLSRVPAFVDAVTFLNYESAVERDDIKEPFTEVSLFKKNNEHIPRSTYNDNIDVACNNNSGYFLTYENGKSAARIQNHLRPNGAHRWDNYVKAMVEMKLYEGIVLHYSYAKFSDLTSRHNRCSGCKPEEEKLGRCFMLDFDKEAFIISSNSTEEEMLQWFREHIVWPEKRIVEKLVKNGMFTRIFTPMVIIRGLRESGVFSSVITSAQTNRSNSTRTTQNKEISPTNVGNINERKDSHSTARRVLQIENHLKFQAPAVPPRLHLFVHV